MDNQRPTLAIVGITLLIVLGVSGLIWLNLLYVNENPGGADFLWRWLGTREFVMTGQSPYSQATSTAIARVAIEENLPDGELAYFFSEPFYALILYAPFALIEDFNLTRAIWMTVIEIGLIAFVIISLLLSRWRLKPLMWAIFFVSGLVWFYSLGPILVGNSAVLIALTVVAAWLAMRAEHDGLAGFLFALGMIKPQLVVPLLLFVFLWGISHRRWTLLWSYVGSLLLLVAGTSLFLTDWTIQYLRQLLGHLQIAMTSLPWVVLKERLPGVGDRLGWGISLILVLILIWEWRLALDKDFNWFYWTANLTLVVTCLIGLPVSPVNHLLLFPALVLVLATWDRKFALIGRIMAVVMLAFLVLGSWWIVLRGSQGIAALQANATLMFALPSLLLVGLYWVRWWVIRVTEPTLAQLDGMGEVDLER